MEEYAAEEGDDGCVEEEEMEHDGEYDEEGEQGEEGAYEEEGMAKFLCQGSVINASSQSGQ